MKITNATIVLNPADFSRWQEVASLAEKSGRTVEETILRLVNKGLSHLDTEPAKTNIDRDFQNWARR